MFAAADFDFVGDSYQAPMVLQDAEDAINWYLESCPEPRAKMPNALLGTPGLNALLATQLGEVRGMWVLPGSQKALVVTGNMLYAVTILTPATSTTPPTFSATAVGTLLTSTGQVSMRDNGVLQNGLGGYCLIVDGTYGYYYLLSGTTYLNTFTANTQGSTLLSFPGSLPNGLIVSSGGTLSAASGLIPFGTKVSSVDTIGLTLTMTASATGSQANDTITLSIPVFGQILDPGFLGAQKIAFIEGWLILNQPNTRVFYTTGPTPYQILFPGSFFSLKDSSSDNLITLEEQNRELWLFGERTSEVWYNAGGANFAFARIPGVGPQIGCAAVYSLTRCGTQLVWLGRNEQGQNMIVATQQYSWERLSTHAIEHAITSYPVVNDAIAYCYEDEGHLFYVITFPTADVTWVYDFASKRWHKRLSWDPVAGVYHRHRSNCYMDFGDVRIVGDYQTGYLLQMSRQYYAENNGSTTTPLRALRRTPHIWAQESRQQIFPVALQVEFTPGVGLVTGQGSDPQALMRFSDDGGFTWSNQRTASIGLIGQTKKRVKWRALGMPTVRDRVWEVVVSDPVPRDIIGSTLWAEAAAA